jgi:predicted flap endonuclease-1-like 5' DNA nuclease
MTPRLLPTIRKKLRLKKKPKLNDLKIIEGVGPKIEQLLKEGGINTWEELGERFHGSTQGNP